MDQEFLQQVSSYVASSLEAIKAQEDANMKLACDLNVANSEISRLKKEICELSNSVKTANTTSTKNLSLAIDVIDQCKDKGFCVNGETYKIASKIAKDPMEALVLLGDIVKSANVQIEQGAPFEKPSFVENNGNCKSLKKVAEILNLNNRDSEKEFNF